VGAPVLGPSGLLSPLVKSAGLVMIPPESGRAVQSGRGERAVVRRVLIAFVMQTISTTPGDFSAVSLVASYLAVSRYQVSFHVWRGYLHVAAAFRLAHYYQAVIAWGP
jgi:hypothetical protein